MADYRNIHEDSEVFRAEAVTRSTLHQLGEVMYSLQALIDGLYIAESNEICFLKDADVFTVYDAMDSLSTIAREMRVWLSPTELKD